MTEQTAMEARLCAALQQARATANARRNAVRMAYQQVQFLHGNRKRAWEGSFLRRLCEAADSDREGCVSCDGQMEVSAGSSEPHLPAYPEMCPDCDSAAPGFAPVKVNVDAE